MLDAKRLLAIGEDGLEQWTPVLKAEFPLSAEDLGTVLELLGAAPVAGGAADIDALLAIVAADPDLLAVGVRKHREHYTLDGLHGRAQRAHHRRGRGAHDRDRVDRSRAVRALVRDLRLGALPVTCVARALRTLAGFSGRRWAVIDVGPTRSSSTSASRTARAAGARWSTARR